MTVCFVWRYASLPPTIGKEAAIYTGIVNYSTPRANEQNQQLEQGR